MESNTDLNTHGSFGLVDLEDTELLSLSEHDQANAIRMKKIYLGEYI
jgi:hypothetical protein